jgi:hypothetical protein
VQKNRGKIKELTQRRSHYIKKLPDTISTLLGFPRRFPDSGGLAPQSSIVEKGYLNKLYLTMQ